jgi:hypothetical protein
LGYLERQRMLQVEGDFVDVPQADVEDRRESRADEQEIPVGAQVIAARADWVDGGADGHRRTLERVEELAEEEREIERDLAQGVPGGVVRVRAS